MTRQIYNVQKSGNLFFVKAAVASSNGQPRILRLLVDTGASQTSLSKILLADLDYTWSDSAPNLFAQLGTIRLLINHRRQISP